MSSVQSEMAVSFVSVVDVVPVIEILVSRRTEREGELGNQPICDSREKWARILSKRMQIKAVEGQRGEIDHKRRSCQADTREYRHIRQ